VGIDNAERYHFRDFTRANYRRLIRIAKRTYAFRTYLTFDHAERFVLWRHDVDFSPHAALKLARIEAEEGVCSTYFVHLHSEFYNLLELEVSDCVQAISALGHDVGLHFDAAFCKVRNQAELVSALLRERRIVEEVFERPCLVMSFHNPTHEVAQYDRRSYAGMVNAASSYFKKSVGFCSDSNGYWRGRRLEDVLRAADDERLQVLTHAEMWPPVVMSPRKRVHRCIDGRALKTKRYYADLLKKNRRLDIDDR
jgi:hypothetical protein